MVAGGGPKAEAGFTPAQEPRLIPAPTEGPSRTGDKRVQKPAPVRPFVTHRPLGGGPRAGRKGER